MHSVRLLLGRLTRQKPRKGVTVSYAYDAAGNLISVTEGSRTTRYEYDLLGNCVKTVYPDGTGETASYDALGNLTAAADAPGKRICGNCYNTEYEGYIFVDAMGNIIRPGNLTTRFSEILKKNNLRHIRFHDLRHSCASLLLANDVPMKQIQEWLGHSDISTTANIYSHLDYKSKITSANVMDSVLTLPDSNSKTGWQT